MGEESDEEGDYDFAVLTKNYVIMYKKSLAIININKLLASELSKVKREKEEVVLLNEMLKEEVAALKEDNLAKDIKLDDLQKMFKMMNNKGTDKMEEILEKSKFLSMEDLNHDIDEDEKGNVKMAWVPKVKVKAPKPHEQSKEPMMNLRVQEENMFHNMCLRWVSTGNLPRRKYTYNFRPICHYCDRLGHIRPNCRFYIKERRRIQKESQGQNYRRNNHKGFVVHTSLNTDL